MFITEIYNKDSIFTILIKKAGPHVLYRIQ